MTADRNTLTWTCAQVVRSVWRLLSEHVLACHRCAYACPSQADADDDLSVQVARSAWRLLSEHVSACARCDLVGCFQACHRCMTTHYCRERCQK